MKQVALQVQSLSRVFVFAVLAALLLTAPRLTVAQQAAAPRHARIADPADNPATSETPKSEEEQENGFLNAPVVHKAAHLMGVSEPTARVIFLAINFAIIFFAIAIPLTRTMPKIFRKRSQTLRHSLELARQATEEARQRLSVVEAKLAGLGDDIAAFRTQIEQESLEDEKRIKASLKEESERIVAAVEQEIGAAATHARRGLREFAANLAIEHATRQLTLTPEADRELIHNFIGQVAGEAAAANGQVAEAVTGGKK